MASIPAAAMGFWTAQLKNNARQGRALLQGVYQNIDAVPLNGVRSGVLASTSAGTVFSDGVVTFVSGLQLAVAPFVGVAHRAGQGPYEGWLASSVNVSVDTAPGSNPRNDIVIMRMYDAALGDTVPGGGTIPCQIEIVTGTPAGSPVDPVTPNTLGVITSGMGAGGGVGIPLFRAQVAVGGAITLTDIRRGAAQLGSVRKVLPGDSDSLGSVGDLRMNGNVLELLTQALGWIRAIPGDNSLTRGTMADVVSASSTALTTGEVIAPEVATFTAVSGRRYKITHVRGEAIAGGATVVTARYRVAAGASVTTAGTLIDSRTFTASGTFSTICYVTTWVATFSGQATIGVGGLVNGGGTGPVASGRRLLIEDAGV